MYMLIKNMSVMIEIMKISNSIVPALSKFDVYDSWKFPIILSRAFLALLTCSIIPGTTGATIFGSSSTM